MNDSNLSFMQSRIAGYASTDHEKLNDDQKRSVKTLPSLEAVQKELEEVKRAIEVWSSVPFLFNH